MLSDDKTTSSSCKRYETCGVFAGLVVWWIEEGDFGGIVGEQNSGAATHDSGFGGDTQRAEIFAKRGERRRVTIDKDYVPRAAAECFNPNRAAAGIGIQKNRTRKTRGKNGEQRFAQAVRCRADGKSRRAFQAAAAKTAGDDSQFRLLTSSRHLP
jgi:hypothetical protein